MKKREISDILKNRLPFGRPNCFLRSNGNMRCLFLPDRTFFCDIFLKAFSISCSFYNLTFAQISAILISKLNSIKTAHMEGKNTCVYIALGGHSPRWSAPRRYIYSALRFFWSRSSAASPFSTAEALGSALPCPMSQKRFSAAFCSRFSEASSWILRIRSCAKNPAESDISSKYMHKCKLSFAFFRKEKGQRRYLCPFAFLSGFFL